MSSGLREQKKAATRQSLTDAALRLSLERGFDAVTVEAIAAEAGVSPRTFFNYFPSREVALIGDAEVLDQAVRAAFAERPAHEPLPVAVGEALLAVVGAELDEPWRLVARTRLAATSPAVLSAQLAAFAQVEAILVALVVERTGLPADHPYPAMLGAGVATAFRLSVLHWAGLTSGTAAAGCLEINGPPPPAHRLRRRLHELLELLGTGLASPPV